MSFCTAINCMDGRFQESVVRFLKERFGVAYVDMITEPGPVRILHEASDTARMNAIFERVAVSVGKHGSRHIAVIGHEDCAGNPVDKAAQAVQTQTAVKRLTEAWPTVDVIGFWANLDGSLEELV
jgi:carbonic anhydrase